MRRRSQLPPDDDVMTTEDLLAGYEVTRLSIVRRLTGLPVPVWTPPTMPNALVPTVQEGIARRPDLHAVDERREAPRMRVAWPVAVAHAGEDGTDEGVTVDVSRTGMCLHMAIEPAAAYEDIAVGHDADCAIVWATVLGYRDALGSGYLWHVQVIAADEGWEALIDRAEQASDRPGVPQVASRGHALVSREEPDEQRVRVSAV
jgi:hypothetical protein